MNFTYGIWIKHRKTFSRSGKQISLWKRRYRWEKKQFGPFRDTKKEIIIYVDCSICSNEKSFCSFLLPRYVRRVRLLLLPVIVEQQHVKHESVASVGGNHDPYLNHSSHHPTSPLVNRRTARFSYIVNRCMQRGKKKATNSAGLRDKLNSWFSITDAVSCTNEFLFSSSVSKCDVMPFWLMVGLKWAL